MSQPGSDSIAGDRTPGPLRIRLDLGYDGREADGLFLCWSARKLAQPARFTSRSDTAAGAAL